MSDASYLDDQAPRIPVADPSDYFRLLKPRVMSLVVLTALAGLLLAPVPPPGGPPPFRLLRRPRSRIDEAR